MDANSSRGRRCLAIAAIRISRDGRPRRSSAPLPLPPARRWRLVPRPCPSRMARRHAQCSRVNLGHSWIPIKLRPQRCWTDRRRLGSARPNSSDQCVSCLTLRKPCRRSWRHSQVPGNGHPIRSRPVRPRNWGRVSRSRVRSRLSHIAGSDRSQPRNTGEVQQWVFTRIHTDELHRRLRRYRILRV